MQEFFPRLYGMQGRRSDNIKKTAVLQVNLGILSFKEKFGKRPGMTNGEARKGIDIAQLEDDLVGNGILSSLPNIPISYTVMKKDGVPDEGFLLMVETDTPGNSNRVVKEDARNLQEGLILNTEELQNIIPCKSVRPGTQGYSTFGKDEKGDCAYYDSSNLRYIAIH